MTAPSLLDELEGVVRRITDDAAEVRRTGGDPERERHTQRIAVNFIRTHHTEIADMAKRLEAAERDAAELRRQLGMMTKLAVKLRKDIDAMSHDGGCVASQTIQSTLCPCGSSLCNGEEDEA